MPEISHSVYRGDAVREHAVKAVTLAVLAAFAVPAWAQSTQQLDPITVTATRTPLPQSQALADLTILTRADIERAQAIDIAELLRTVTGVEIARNGGPGQVTSVFLRGGESNHTLILIDGARLNPATAGGAALQNLSPELIERIEVLKGPRATLYGSDAIAGVINIITRAPDGTSIGGSLRGGSLGTREATLHSSFAGADHGIGLQAQTAHSDGIAPCAFGGPDRGYDRNSFAVNAGGKAGRAEYDARFFHAEGNTEYVDFCDPGFGNQPLDQDFRNQVAQLNARLSLTGIWHTELSLRRMVDDIRQQQANYLGQKDRVRTVRPSADWHHTLDFGPKYRLSGGLRYARESVDALSYGTLIEEDRDIWSAYLQQEWNRGPHRTLLAAAFTDHDAFGSQWTWNAEYGWSLTDRIRVGAAAGTAFRAPDATDRFGFGGNPDLDSERATNVEMFWQQSIGQTQSLRLSVFQSNVDDLIAVVFDPAAPADDPSFGFHAVNIDRYRNRGLELDYTARVGRWAFNAGGIAQDPEDRSSGEALLRRARRSAHFSALYRIGRDEAGIEVLAQGRRPDVDAQSGAATESGGYALLNLVSRLQFARAWSLQARIDNALDKDYQTAAGFAQPGRTAYLTLRYSN